MCHSDGQGWPIALYFWAQSFQHRTTVRSSLHKTTGNLLRYMPEVKKCFISLLHVYNVLYLPDGDLTALKWPPRPVRRQPHDPGGLQDGLTLTQWCIRVSHTRASVWTLAIIFYFFKQQVMNALLRAVGN